MTDFLRQTNKRYSLFIFIIVVVLFSCSTNRVPCKDKMAIDATRINNSLLVQIDSFINSHPDIRSIVVLTDVNIVTREDFPMHSYFLISPAYNDISYFEGHYPSTYFHYKNTIIFIQSTLDGLVNSKAIKDMYDKFCIKRDYQNEHKLIWEIFYENSFLCKKMSSDSCILISTKAAPFFKKRIEFIPPVVQNYDKVLDGEE